METNSQITVNMIVNLECLRKFPSTSQKGIKVIKA